MTVGELGRVYACGEVICREGDKGDVMYVIQSGSVKITKQAHSGDIELATLGSGEMFGEMALFDKLPRSATAKAVGEARVLSIDKKKLFQTITNDPTLVFRILETMSRRIRRIDETLAGLMEAKTALLRSLGDMHETCEMILAEARNIVKADNGSIMLYDETTRSLPIAAAFGTESSRKIMFSAGEGIAGDVFRTGQAELVNNVAIDSRFKSGEMQIRSILCVPLKHLDAQLGILNMSLTSERLFTIDDLKAINSLAPYAAMAIHNARNYSTLRHATDNLVAHATLLNM